MKMNGGLRCHDRLRKSRGDGGMRWNSWETAFPCPGVLVAVKFPSRMTLEVLGAIPRIGMALCLCPLLG